MSGNETGWVKVAGRGDLADGDVLGVVSGGHDIALYEQGGSVYATDNVCSHGNARLSDGWLDADEIECPLHAGRFNIKTGKATCPPCIVAVRVYEVRVAGDDIEVKLD